MITLINPPGIKTFSGLQMHTPNPPLGLAYIVAAIKDAGFLYHAVALKRSSRPQLPMQVFRFSVSYLMWLFAALLIDHYLPTLRGA